MWRTEFPIALNFGCHAGIIISITARYLLRAQSHDSNIQSDPIDLADNRTDRPTLCRRSLWACSRSKVVCQMRRESCLRTPNITLELAASSFKQKPISESSFDEIETEFANRASKSRNFMGSSERINWGASHSLTL